MIRVTIEVIPFGEDYDKRKLETITIWNTGKGNLDKGDYSFKIEEREDKSNWKGETFKKKYTKIKHFRDEGVVKLLYLCLKRIYDK